MLQDQLTYSAPTQLPTVPDVPGTAPGRSGAGPAARPAARPALGGTVPRGIIPRAGMTGGDHGSWPRGPDQWTQNVDFIGRN